MRYDFSKMDSNSFEEMIRNLNEGIFAVFSVSLIISALFLCVQNSKALTAKP